MTIEITDKLVGMWYYPIGPDSDWLGAVTKTDDGYELVYRHRYYVDDEVGLESEDTKNWYKGTIKGHDMSPAEVAAKMRDLAEQIASVLGAEVTEILMHDGDVDRFVEELSEQPFSHVQVLDKKEMH